MRHIGIGAAAVICWAGVLAGPVASQEARDTVTVTILHSNDVYGQLTRRPGEGAAGGAAARAHLIREAGRTGPTLVLDGGDALGPDPVSVFDRGQVMIAAMRLAGYHAMAPGNHEFALGPEALSQRQAEAGFPFLSANVKAKGGGAPPVEASLLTEVGGVPVGVFGLVSPEVATQVDPKRVAGWAFNDPVKAAGTVVEGLRERGAAFVIALVHMREPEALALARGVPGVDLVVAGGYRGLDRPAQVPTQTRLLSGTQLVTTPRYGLYLGRVDVRFARTDEGAYRVIDTRVTQTPVDASAPEDAEVVARVARLEAAYLEATGEELGRIAADGQETLGQVVANLMRRHTGSEVGVVNRGGIGLAGASEVLSLRDVDRLVRFDDALVTVGIKGRFLKAAVARSQGVGQEGKGLIFAGLDPKALTVNQRPIADEEVYRVALPEFLAEGGDGYAEFRQAEAVIPADVTLRPLVVSALREEGTVSPALFAGLDRRGVWRGGWSVEAAFNRNYIDRTTEAYREKKERVSFLSGKTSVAWNGSIRASLVREQGRHVVALENRAEFGQIGAAFRDLAKSTDLVDEELSYRYRARVLKVDPFVSAGLSTGFTRTDGRRPMQVRGSAGFLRQVYPNLAVRFAGRGQRDFAVDANDVGAEVTVEYQQKLGVSGRLQSRVRGFFGFTDRRVVSVENYNTLSFSLAGSLGLTVRQNNFIYRVNQIRGVAVDGVAFRVDMMVGFAYRLNRKWL